MKPISGLYLALDTMVCLHRLRVFDVRGTHFSPTGEWHHYLLFQIWCSVLPGPHLRYHLTFERSMFPLMGAFQFKPELVSYQLMLDPGTRVIPFQVLSSECLQTLRLSGDCHLDKTKNLPSLRHLTMHAVTSNFFDQQRLGECFPESQLESFIYAHGHRLGFEIRDHHLHSIVTGPGSQLHKLVLLGCSRLTSGAIASCLRSLPTLKYLALSLITVKELSENIAASLPQSITVLKIQVTHAWYSIPLITEERELCNVLEEGFMQKKPPPEALYLSMHNEVMNEGERIQRWKGIAAAVPYKLKIGPWEDDEDT